MKVLSKTKKSQSFLGHLSTCTNDDHNNGRSLPVSPSWKGSQGPKSEDPFLGGSSSYTEDRSLEYSSASSSEHIKRRNKCEYYTLSLLPPHKNVRSTSKLAPEEKKLYMLGKFPNMAGDVSVRMFESRSLIPDRFKINSTIHQVRSPRRCQPTSALKMSSTP